MGKLNTIIEKLPSIRGRYTEGPELSRLTWFRVGGPAEVLYKPADLEDLSFFLKHKTKEIPALTIGVGSNLLIRDGGIPGVVVRLQGFNNIVVQGNEIEVGAGVLDRTLALVAQEEGLQNLEFLAGIPGTIGGALRMNAGCYGIEIKDILVSALAVDNQGKIHKLTPEDMGFSYRHCKIPQDWIFVGARFKAKSGDSQEIAARMEKLLTEREDAQPVKSRTGGSTFANPEGYKAWELIDKAGGRGLKIGGAQVSEKHCNFLINTGDATAEDLELLGETIRARVLENSGIDLRWEIVRMGFNKNYEVKAKAA
ncbi:UDP-N-acetylenolpyruvoylglucosamine reductase [Candidatus Paracaedimonas acanthamoebae]|nr:UDP-N-acetylenolpyruvoylglucosamine reductase [Candidatus Paracaedimonas acanthamoebae]